MLFLVLASQCWPSSCPKLLHEHFSDTADIKKYCRPVLCFLKPSGYLASCCSALQHQCGKGYHQMCKSSAGKGFSLLCYTTTGVGSMKWESAWGTCTVDFGTILCCFFRRSRTKGHWICSADWLQLFICK